MKQPKPDDIRDIANLMRYPGFASAHARLPELQHRLLQTEARIDELSGLLTTGAGVGSGLLDKISGRAAALLSGDVAALGITSGSNLRTELAKLREDRPVLQEAIHLQRMLINRERQTASEEICAEIRPQYLDAVREVAQALVALGRAAERERYIRREAIDADIMFVSYLRPMPFNAGGYPSDRNSNISAWLRDALEFKLIDRGDVPGEWLTKWNA
jgi:hypothetical protein